MLDSSLIGGVGGSGATDTQAAKKQFASDFDDFLKLFLVQLQNQNPLDSLDTNELTAQIATLTEVEQSLNTNEKLDALIAASTTSQFTDAIGLVGKEAEVLGDFLIVDSENLSSNNPVNPKLAYFLTDKAKEVSISIKDADGFEVLRSTAADLPPGRHETEWDMTDKTGQKVPPGTYTVEVTVKYNEGDLLGEPAATFVRGIVTAISSTDEGLMAFISNQIEVPIDQIFSVGVDPQGDSSEQRDGS